MAKLSKAGNDMNTTNLEPTGFCNNSNTYNTIATSVNDRYTKLTSLFFDRTSNNFIICFRATQLADRGPNPDLSSVETGSQDK